MFADVETAGQKQIERPIIVLPGGFVVACLCVLFAGGVRVLTCTASRSTASGRTSDRYAVRPRVAVSGNEPILGAAFGCVLD